MIWSGWKCRQTITAAKSDFYTASAIRDHTLILGRNKGFVEAYSVGPSLKKKIEFKSHSPCFDYLKSVEISETIHAIDTVPSGNKELLLLCANSKSVKLWNLHSSYIKSEGKSIIECCSDASSMDPVESPEEEMESSTIEYASDASSPEKQRKPEVSTGTDSSSDDSKGRDAPGARPSAPAAECDMSPEMKQLFTPRERSRRSTVHLETECNPQHIYNIHSVHTSPNAEKVLVADELSVNVWTPDLAAPVLVVDIKPPKLSDLTRVITCARFKKNSNNVFVYSTSDGTLEFHDMRLSSKSEVVASICADSSVEFYREIVRSISDFCFVGDDVVASRNFQNVVCYDLRSPRSVLLEKEVLPLVKKKISELYETDGIFTRFKIDAAGKRIYTGSFNTFAMEIDLASGEHKGIFLDPAMSEATRVVGNKKVACISACEDALVATVENLCHIFRKNYS